MSVLLKWLVGCFAAFGLVVVIWGAYQYYDSERTREANKDEQLAWENLQNNPVQVSGDEFFVFVGEQLNIEFIPEDINPDTIIQYDHYEATYRVVQAIWGNYQEDTIAFSVYDHYGLPPFANDKYTMLFVTKQGRGWTQELYQAYPVSRTEEGDWAYCGDPTPERWESEPAEMHKVVFDPPVYFDIRHYSESGLAERFPAPIWEHVSDRAYCVMGTGPEELFRIKREGVLRARGLSFDLRWAL
jgi:hypothetical protein